MLNNPSKSVVAPVVVPLTTIVAPGSGLFSASLMVPPTCAKAIVVAIKATKFRMVFFVSIIMVNKFNPNLIFRRAKFSLT